MSGFVFPCPTPPNWRVPWDELNAVCPLLVALAGCPQEPRYHGEGDVAVHLRMVLAELAGLPAWRELPDNERSTVFAAAVLHDVGKPDCTRVEADGRISSRGHSRRGAILARSWLWHAGADFDWREQVCALVRFHQLPYFLIDRPDATRLCIEISHVSRCDHLALLAEADVRGRVAADVLRLLDNVALFVEQAGEENCLSAPRPFASDHARFLYFQDESRHPDAPTHDDTRAEVVLMSGLPGAGKDYFVRTHLAGRPVIALDDVRQELGIGPEDDQGAVVNAARQKAREWLRQGEAFVWNATNLSRQLRNGHVGLFAAYKARVRIVYVEAPYVVLFEQNRKRRDVVPEKVINRLLDRWEVPDATEAHQVEYCVRTE